MRGRSFYRLFLCLFLSLTGFDAAVGQCDNWESTTFEYVDSMVFVNGGNETFPKIFKLRVTWDPDDYETWSEGDLWGYQEILDFADILINDDPQDSNNYANEIIEYFSFDADTTHAVIDIVGATSFGIYLNHYESSSCAGLNPGSGGSVGLGMENGNVYSTPTQVANYAFAHEWQHIAHEVWEHGEDPDYGLSYSEKVNRPDFTGDSIS